MPHISELRESKFLKKEDCGRGITVTISGCDQQNIAKEGAPAEMKWVLHFHEQEKPLVLNSTNGQIIAGIVGSEETDDWQGKKVTLYHDPNITFQGKLVGGIRVRAPEIGGSFGWSLDEAIAECNKIGINREAMIAALKSKGLTGWNSAKCTPIVQQLIDAAQHDLNGSAEEDIPFAWFLPLGFSVSFLLGLLA